MPPAVGEQVFVPDRRGNRLERYSFEVAADGRRHRLLLRASAEIADQFRNIAPVGPSYQLADSGNLSPRGWTHCLEAPGTPDARISELADLLSEVITLPRLPSVEFAIARDWYKVPAEGVAADDWRNTADGQRVSVGKYWTKSPEAMAEAGRALVRRLLRVVERHPVLASAGVVVAAPGHDRTYLSFGERIAASLSRALGLPLIEVATSREFRPPAKDLSGTGEDAMRGVFAVHEDLTGATAILVDDVFRTGMTMSAVGSAVREAGATRVGGLVAVRTMRR
jgi:pyrimidine operon attenuation protein/uracil phosphoribosyltransferase